MMENYEHYLEKNIILYAGLLQVLRRGTAEILEENESGIFLRDTVSNCFMLAVDHIETGKQWLKAHENLDYKLLLLFHQELARFAWERYALPPMMECVQAVYMSDEPPVLHGKLKIKPAAGEDFQFVSDNYGMLTEQELKEIFRQKNIFIGFHENEPVGFVGQHLEGSMGLLEVFPEYYRKGYGSELECFMICHMMEAGLIPFCQIETDNMKSLRLQEKLGLTISKEHMYWLG